MANSLIFYFPYTIQGVRKTNSCDKDISRMVWFEYLKFVIWVTHELNSKYETFNVVWILALTLAPTELATSSNLVLNSNGLQLQILCCNLNASRHLAAPSIDSIWITLSPRAAAEPIAVLYCLKAFWNIEKHHFISHFRSSIFDNSYWRIVIFYCNKHPLRDRQ